MTSDEKFAIAQAMHGVVAEQVKTRTDGNLRAEADRASLELYEQTGGKVRDLVVCGAKVGEIRCETKSSWAVTDPQAYDQWCRTHDAMNDTEDINLGLLGMDDYWQAYKYLKENFPDAFTVDSKPIEPGDWWLVRTESGAVIDMETGEVVPGVEYGTHVVKTVVSGCRWDESRMTKTERSKFVPVSVAARGIQGGAVAALMGEVEQ